MTTERRLALGVASLGKTFGAVTALSDVTLEVEAGSVLALLGENGAGKSTFISLVSGAVTPSSGTIEISGEPARLNSPHDAARLGIQVVHQEPKLTNEGSIAENIFLADYAGGTGLQLVSLRRRVQRAETLLSKLGLADGLPPVTTSVHRLSAAQRQLVAIAKAMATEARVLFLDEPNSSLTPRETTQLWNLVRALRDSGVAVIVVSHRLSELYQVVDRVAVLRDGRLVATGTAAEIPIPRAVELMAGRQSAPVKRAERPARGDVVLQMEGVHTRSVHGVDLTVHAGEVVGLAGLVGAGRTEIGLAACGGEPVLAGRVSIDGRERRFRSPRAALRAGVVMTSEERRRAVFASHDVTFNIAGSSLERLSRLGVLSRGRERGLAGDWVRRLALRGSPGSPILSLSGGNQQKALLARALAVKPRLVILDEPTHGIDVNTKAEISALVGRLAAEGLAVIFISSEVEELLGVADRVAVVRDGRIVQEASGTDGIGLVAAALGETLTPRTEPSDRSGLPS
ncbi:sugar ABC transporter ATP-binding protein [Streptomyces albipurpureus]|uniref:Sugar ABC transporter ATP-binding protein n=1 Tax=Streptomyces albipurpureus TaxID=2897419 RepID=A0ABT0UG48_9ACTN|nr:sugar ABC transporter ATP-binding protein [Streptomyces sp. CWNU-1]MCM2387604.1 sugar ABC transporter ATP-binding protein [Streptomyces sp. CWNU-1]